MKFTFDHVNIRTANLQNMLAFYRDVLGLKSGNRPPFPFGGAWMYCGDQPIVHLVEVKTPPSGESPRLEHFALRSEGLADFLVHLREHRIPYEIGVVPGWEMRQVNFFDPDGNHIHIDFQSHEQADLSHYSGS
jgi:catechol 2,3-dioxygenase-like lactoylglutathione lyase family enzyme